MDNEIHFNLEKILHISYLTIDNLISAYEFEFSTFYKDSELYENFFKYLETLRNSSNLENYMKTIFYREYYDQIISGLKVEIIKEMDIIEDLGSFRNGTYRNVGGYLIPLENVADGYCSEEEDDFQDYNLDSVSELKF